MRPPTPEVRDYRSQLRMIWSSKFEIKLEKGMLGKEPVYKKSLLTAGGIAKS
jgi:hypothetical protein